MMKSERSAISVLIPILLSVALAIGIYSGVWIADRGTGKRIEWAGEASPDSLSLSEQQSNVDRIFRLIERKYVDTMDRKKLARNAIEEVLSELDPHSYYIPAKKEKEVNQPLEGNFEGIGIQFMIQKDTVVVVTPISGGPSESLGIRPGDRIVEVEGENIAGIGIENKDVIDRLRGEKGSQVKITIHRPRTDTMVPFEITRGEIPIRSVDVGYMVDERSGYVKISRFSQQTHKEFRKESKELLSNGMERMILDLRGNGGGYLHSAIKIADEFLRRGEMIVYTEGRSHPKKTHDATNKGILHDVKLAILIDEGSASASEIVSGAVQDHDRGVIVGRRSFGKGLVQEQIELPGMGAIRLTVARYHTPSGRCIQKPYGKEGNYDKEIYKRYEEGELLSADSIDFPDSLQYRTDSGRVVYGGGGIMPDFFVPIDTQEVSPHYSELIYQGVVNEIAFDHADKHRETLKARFGSPEEFRMEYELPGSLMEKVLNRGQKNGIEYEEGEREKISKELSTRLKALIGRNIWNEEAYFPIILQEDPVFLRANEALEKGMGPL